MNAFAAAMLLGGVVAYPPDDAVKCDLPATANMAEIYTMLSRRAVEAIDRVRQGGWESDSRLAAIVVPSADFSLGVSDVGRPFGNGVTGLRAMALVLRADRFRYSGWTGAPPPLAKPCDEWKTDVEFIDDKTGTTSTIKFSFRDGRMISAAGWEGRFIDGPIDAIER